MGNAGNVVSERITSRERNEKTEKGLEMECDDGENVGGEKKMSGLTGIRGGTSVRWPGG